MASELLLRGSASGSDDCWQLSEHDEELVGQAARQLAAYATEPERAAVVHRRDGEVLAAWNGEGAARLAQLLPPGYAELQRALVERHAA